MRRRVLIVDLQQIYRGVRSLYIPLVHGVLRVHAEQDEALRQGLEWLEPLCILDTTENLLAQVDAPDVVGFSTYLWNERNGHALARAIKARWPACTVVFGGPQVPRAPSDYLERHPWVDLLVHGEGEIAFTGILRQVVAGSADWASIPGVSFREGGGQRFGPPSQRLPDLDLPSPFLSGYFDDFITRGRDAGFHIVASLETSRGCPYACAFCSWGMATKTKPRHLSDERVRQEFAWVAEQRIHMVFIIDANYGILPRDVDMLAWFAELKATRGYPQSVLLSGFAKNHKDRTFELTRILQDHKLDEGVTVNFSLQATSTATLEAIDRQNIPLEGYRALSDKYAQHGYTLTPDLIFPLPGETLESFTRGYADLASWAHVNRIRVYPCCILPNTPMAAPDYRARWGLATRIEVLRIPLLEPLHDGLQDEHIETVTHTRLIPPEDAVEAKVFVAVVNALEIYGLTRALRRGLARMHGVDTRDFYTRWITWQGRDGARFDRVLADMRESFAAGTEHGEELGWTGRARTCEDEWMMPVKALTVDAMLAPRLFREDLRAFITEALGIACGALEDELLAFQADAWIGPDHDPRVENAFSYGCDWSTFLRPVADRATGSRPARIPITVRYAPRESVMRFGYVPARLQWNIHYLSQWQPDTFCCRFESEQQVQQG